MNRIRELRNEYKLKQIDFCKIIGVSQAALSGYETGNYQPDNDILIKIADYFDTTVDYLMGRTDIKKTPTPEDVSGLTPKQLKIIEMMDQMTPEQQTELVRQAEYQLWMRKQKKDNP